MKKTFRRGLQKDDNKNGILQQILIIPSDQDSFWGESPPPELKDKGLI